MMVRKLCFQPVIANREAETTAETQAEAKGEKKKDRKRAEGETAANQ